MHRLKRYSEIQKSLCIVSFILLAQFSFSQTDTVDSNLCRQRRTLTGVSAVSAYSLGMTGLYSLWYAGYPQTNFHLFNDNHEWLQMDKIGHAFTSYNIGELGYHLTRFSCVDEKHSIWLGGSAGMIFLTTVEIFDGFSAAWGASVGDIAANTSGWLLFVLQQEFLHEQKFRMKYSFHPSPYAKYRPNVLGSGFTTEFIKDYNGQSYWLSFNPLNFSSLREPQFFPKWLCLSFGYSGDGMTGGSFNPLNDKNGNPLPLFKRQRQYYLSLDIDFSKIQTKSPMLKKLFYCINYLKMPFPAVEFTKEGTRFIPVYF